MWNDLITQIVKLGKANRTRRAPPALAKPVDKSKIQKSIRSIQTMERLVPAGRKLAKNAKKMYQSYVYNQKVVPLTTPIKKTDKF